MSRLTTILSEAITLNERVTQPTFAVFYVGGFDPITRATYDRYKAIRKQFGTLATRLVISKELGELPMPERESFIKAYGIDNYLICDDAKSMARHLSSYDKDTTVFIVVMDRGTEYPYPSRMTMRWNGTTQVSFKSPTSPVVYYKPSPNINYSIPSIGRLTSSNVRNFLAKCPDTQESRDLIGMVFGPDCALDLDKVFRR